MVSITKRLSEIIENINNSDKKEISDLKLIIKKYPFFQVAYTILAKKLFQNNSITKNKALEIAAIYASDRQKLKEIIMSKSSNKTSNLIKNKNFDNGTYIDETIMDGLNKSMPSTNNNEKLTTSVPTFSEEIIDDSYYSDAIISESLAKIMIEQKKIELAIKIYNRLILKLPQKKAYFVKIINKLKTKL